MQYNIRFVGFAGRESVSVIGREKCIDILDRCSTINVNVFTVWSRNL
jgi:prophage tail gpP-like protein